jgi:uncharacterized Zn finger protein
VNWGGRYPPRSRPRRVDDGIKARSARGAIGESWWSRRFIDVLESFSLGSRLTRGKAYARAGQVVAIEVAPGEVSASVQGSRARPYRVSIGLAPFPELVWARVEIMLAEQALYSAKLLAGEMPGDLERLFAEAGAPLFPEGWLDLAMHCSCPDLTVPCKHLAATCYLLAEALDDDPFQLLHWRGRSREALLHRLRELRADRPGPAAGGGVGGGTALGGGGVGGFAVDAGPGGGVGIGAGMALADLAGPELGECVDRFWHAAQPLPQRPPTIDTEPGLLLRQLGTPDRGSAARRW